MTVDLVAKIFRRGRSATLISSNVGSARLAGAVDFTANARRLVGGDERSSLGAIGCGAGAGGGGGAGAGAAATAAI